MWWRRKSAGAPSWSEMRRSWPDDGRPDGGNMAIAQSPLQEASAE